MEVGAYFQCHKQPVATFHALQNFRQAYPNSTIVLLSDNGYNYQKMATKFNAIYIHDTQNIGVSLGYNASASINDCKKLVQRFLTVLPLIKEKFFMMLEDDVYVKAPYTEDFKATINGNCINYIRTATFKNIPFYKGDMLDRPYSGHGGSIYNKDDLISVLSETDKIDWLIDNWMNLERGNRLDCDIFLSLAVYCAGLDIYHLKQHKDGMHNFNSGRVIHQYKSLYNKVPDNTINGLYE